MRKERGREELRGCGLLWRGVCRVHPGGTWPCLLLQSRSWVSPRLPQPASSVGQCLLLWHCHGEDPGTFGVHPHVLVTALGFCWGFSGPVLAPVKASVPMATVLCCSGELRQVPFWFYDSPRPRGQLPSAQLHRLSRAAPTLPGTSAPPHSAPVSLSAWHRAVQFRPCCGQQQA